MLPLLAALVFAAPPAWEKLWGDGTFTEGPCIAPDGSVVFSDIGNRILRYNPADGATKVFREPSGRSNGMKFDAQNRLVVCEGADTGGGRRVSRMDRAGKTATVVDSFEGKRLNSPNDLCIDAEGRVYFTDPRYGGKEPLELGHESVYRVETDGKLTRVVSDVTKPNGVVLSPDGKTLYVAENHPEGARQLLAYPIDAAGKVGAKKVLYTFTIPRGIDGMTVAADGTVVATAGSGADGGIWFFSPAGEKVGFLKCPEDPNNCCWAGPGSDVLYVTAGKSLYRVKLDKSAP